MTRHHRRDLLKASLGTGLLLTAAPFIARRAWADETTFQQAQRTKSITVGVANEKPYGYVDTDNKATGAIVEVLRATLAPYGITDVQAKVGAFDTLIPGLLAKRFDVIGAGMYIKPKRCQQIAFSNPLTQAGGAFAGKKGNPKNLHSLADVAKNSDAKIGTQLGTSQVDEVKQAGIPEDRVTLFSKDTEALAGLQAGRVDVIYFPDLEINNLLDHRYYTGAQLGPTGLSDSGTFLARPLPATANGQFPLVHAIFYAPGTPIGAWGGIRFKF